jgi:hypothetical protein
MTKFFIKSLSSFSKDEKIVKKYNYNYNINEDVYDSDVFSASSLFFSLFINTDS